MKFSKITIKGFRGFNGKQSISLDNGIVIIYGLNGSGKSSFTEALEWLFFDEISRQRLSRCRSEYQYEEYLKNLFYNDAENPFVEVEGAILGRLAKLRKEILKEKERFFIDGKEVANFASLKLNLEPYFRPMLAQTEIKALVDSDQKDRWEQLSSILGQDELSKLRDDLQTLRTDKKDDIYKKDELRWHGILGDLQSSKSIANFYKFAQDLDEQGALKELSLAIGEPESNLVNALIKIKEKLTGLLNTELGRRIAEITSKGSGELKKYLALITAGLGRLDVCAGKIAGSGYDHAELDFLNKGASLAKPPECPFCLEKTLTEERFKKIKEMLGDAKETQVLRGEFGEIKNEINDFNRKCPEEIKQFFPSQQELKIVSQKLLDDGKDQLGAEVQELEKYIESFISAACMELKDLITKSLAYLEDKHFHKAGLANPISGLEIIIDEIIAKQGEVYATWEELRLKIAKVVPASGNVDQDEIKKWLTLEKLTTFFITGGQFIKKTKLLAEIEEIQKKLETFEKSEVARLLKKHETEIKSYYEKLNKGDKVQFLGIEVRPGVRRQAKLTAEAYGKVVNPVTFFSEAHTNSLALSIYFPQRVDRNSTWETIILDDPVQSMDENHSLALIDILEEVIKKKNVIVLTHSRSFYRELAARFAHKKPLVYHFFNNDDQGPSIKLDKGETIEHLARVEEGCVKGSPRDLSSASQSLRQAIESICMDFLLDKGIAFNKVVKFQESGLKTLFAEAETAGLPAAEIGRIKGLLDTGNSNSHAWSIADTTKGGLRSGASYVQSIYDTYLK